MKRGEPLGLDELMIVNPTPSADEARFFLGEDGTLYQVQPRRRGRGAAVAGPSPDEGVGAGVDPGRHFLGADGALYEVVEWLEPTAPGSSAR